LLVDKFRANVGTQLDDARVDQLAELFADQYALETMAIDDLMDLLVPDAG
jgi:hypothetical protein